MSSTLVEQVRAALLAARQDRDTARTLPYSTLHPADGAFNHRIAREVLAG